MMHSAMHSLTEGKPFDYYYESFYNNVLKHLYEIYRISYLIVFLQSGYIVPK